MVMALRATVYNLDELDVADLAEPFAIGSDFCCRWTTPRILRNKLWMMIGRTFAVSANVLQDAREGDFGAV